MSNTGILWGSTLEKSTDGGTTWVNVPEAKGIIVPTTQTDYVEVTSLDSPNGFREFIPGLRDAGEVSFSANFTSNGYAEMLADQNSRALIKYRSTLTLLPGETVPSVFECDGYPTVSKSNTSDPGEAMMMEVTVRISGEATFTEAS